MEQLLHIHSSKVWRDFFSKIDEGPYEHLADFRGIAYVYLYGGMYSDMDALWVRRPPLPFLVLNDQQKYISNGAFGIPTKHHPFLRHVLEHMPLAYNSTAWTYTGANVLSTAFFKLDDATKFPFHVIDYKTMYGLLGKPAQECFLNDENTSKCDHSVDVVLNSSWKKSHGKNRVETPRVETRRVETHRVETHRVETNRVETNRKPDKGWT